MTTGRVLLVEDEALVALEIKRRLEKYGYQVVGVADTLDSALGLAREKHPDIVLMDIFLGNVDGIEIAKRIREELDIGVLYLTAFTDSELLERAKETQPLGYILKPFDERHLITTVEIAIHKAHLEKQLRLQTKRLSAILDSIRDAVISIDKKGRIEFMNPWAEKITGWRETEALGKRIEKVLNIQSEKGSILFEDMLAEWKEPLKLVRKDGAEVLIAGSGAPILSSGKMEGAVMVFQDVTERRKKEIEEQRRQKLEALGLLASGVAHDFNNWLTAIVGNLYTLKEEVSDPKCQVVMQELEECVEKLREAAKKFLAFAKGHLPVLRPCSLWKVMKEAWEKASLGAEMTIQWKNKVKEPAISADPMFLYQVFYNIFLNAVQATDGKGKVTVELREVSSKEVKDVPSLEKERDYIRIAISDTGPGIPEEILPRVFDPYFTTKPEGSGLGLAVAHAIVTQHRGALTVEYEQGKTVFAVYLPLLS